MRHLADPFHAPHPQRPSWCLGCTSSAQGFKVKRGGGGGTAKGRAGQCERRREPAAAAACSPTAAQPTHTIHCSATAHALTGTRTGSPRSRSRPWPCWLRCSCRAEHRDGGRWVGWGCPSQHGHLQFHGYRHSASTTMLSASPLAGGLVARPNQLARQGLRVGAHLKPSAWPEVRPKMPPRLGPCLWPSPGATVWHCAHLVLKIWRRGSRGGGGATVGWQRRCAAAVAVCWHRTTQGLRQARAWQYGLPHLGACSMVMMGEKGCKQGEGRQQVKTGGFERSANTTSSGDKDPELPSVGCSFSPMPCCRRACSVGRRRQGAAPTAGLQAERKNARCRA